MVTDQYALEERFIARAERRRVTGFSASYFILSRVAQKSSVQPDAECDYG
jgi:hypothetical protein